MTSCSKLFVSYHSSIASYRDANDFISLPTNEMMKYLYGWLMDGHHHCLPTLHNIFLQGEGKGVCCTAVKSRGGFLQNK